MSRHVERLFSAAYDGELSPEARAGFDRHLAECPACAAGFARLTTAVDVLREQGSARMPRPVRLPEGSPVGRRRLAGLLARPRWSHGLSGGLAGAGMVALAGGIAALVVIGPLQPGLDHARGGTSFSSGPAVGSSLVPGAKGAEAAPVNPAVCGVTGGCATSQPAVPTATATCSATALSVSASSATEFPTGFNNRTTNDDGSAKVVIATQVDAFTPGETVDVYDRVIYDDTGAVYLPCTSLVAGGSVQAGAAPLSSAPIPAVLAPDLAVTGEPILQVTIPVSTPPNQPYQIVVDVPLSPGSTQDYQVSLTIQVT